jgi:hypothetical protein
MLQLLLLECRMRHPVHQHRLLLLLLVLLSCR